MPRNGSGNMTRTNGSFQGTTVWTQQAASADKKINSQRHDTHDQDMADEMTDSLSRSGKGAMLAPLDLNNNRIINVGEATAGTDAPALQQVVPWNTPASGQPNTTGSAPLATGTTAQRPASPSTGDIRYNTDSDDPEVYKGSSWVGLPAGRAEYPPDHLDGLTITNGVTLGTDYDVSTGSARSDDDQANIDLTTAITNKKLNMVFAEGSNQGGLDVAPAVASSKYYVFVIAKDDGTADILFSLSSTAPTLPTDFTVQRRNGYVVTDATAAGDGRVGQVLNTLEESESISFTSAASRATYDIFWTQDWSKVSVQISGLLPATNNQTFFVRTSADGSTFDSGASDYDFRGLVVGAASTVFGSGGSSVLQITGAGTSGPGNVALNELSGEVELITPSVSQGFPSVLFETYYLNGGSVFYCDGGGRRQTTSIARGIRFVFGSGDISQANFIVRFMR